MYMSFSSGDKLCSRGGGGGSSYPEGGGGAEGAEGGTARSPACQAEQYQVGRIRVR